jgi:hypothetical protein
MAERLHSRALYRVQEMMIPGLHTVHDIPVQMEYYNEDGQVIPQASVVFCTENIPCQCQRFP